MKRRRRWPAVSERYHAWREKESQAHMLSGFRFRPCKEIRSEHPLDVFFARAAR